MAIEKIVEIEIIELEFTLENSLGKCKRVNAMLSHLDLKYSNKEMRSIKVLGELETYGKDFFVLKNEAEKSYDFYDEDCYLIYQAKFGKKYHPLTLPLLIAHFDFLRSEDLLSDSLKFYHKIYQA